MSDTVIVASEIIMVSLAYLGYRSFSIQSFQDHLELRKIAVALQGITRILNRDTDVEVEIVSGQKPPSVTMSKETWNKMKAALDKMNKGKE